MELAELPLTPTLKDVYTRQVLLAQEDSALKRVFQVVHTCATVKSGRTPWTPLRTAVLSTPAQWEDFSLRLSEISQLGEANPALEGYSINDSDFTSAAPGAVLAFAVFPFAHEDRVDPGFASAPWLCTREVIASPSQLFNAVLLDGDCALLKASNLGHDSLVATFRRLTELMVGQSPIGRKMLGVRMRYAQKNQTRFIEVFEADAENSPDDEFVAELERIGQCRFDHWALTPDGNAERSVHDRRDQNWVKAEQQHHQSARGKRRN